MPVSTVPVACQAASEASPAAKPDYTQITQICVPEETAAADPDRRHNGGSRALPGHASCGMRSSRAKNNASAGRGWASILERMVTFRREIRLWRETGVTQRALMIHSTAMPSRTPPSSAILGSA